MPNKNTFSQFLLWTLTYCLLTSPYGVAQSVVSKSDTYTRDDQTSSKEVEQLIENLLENLSENLPDDFDLSELSERLNGLQHHPIDLNHTSTEALKELFFLTPLQISSFFNHLRSHGPLIDLLELQSIDGFDVLTIQRLLPFVYIKTPHPLTGKSSGPVFRESSNDLMLRYVQLLQQKKGFKDLPGSRYLGTSEKLLIRYRYSYAKLISFGLVIEKDPGEQIFNSKTVSDHLSASIALSELRKIKKLVVGDYSMQFGQGLSLWSGFAYGKGPDVTSVAAKDTGLKPYSSSNESSFLRGAGSTICLAKKLDLTGFASYRKLDASLKALPDGSHTLSNINISGLHRTATEIKNQRSLSQNVHGAALKYNNTHLSAGLLIYRSVFQHPFSTGNAAYNRYSFTGKHLTNLSLHYNYSFKNCYFYGETAHSINSGWAVLHGCMASLSSKWSAVLLHRKYEKDYYTFFGQAIGEGTEVSNEEGLYTGINYMPSRKWTFSIYADYFRFPWLRYRVDSASSGKEWLGQLEFAPHKRLKAHFRYRTEVKQQNPDADSKRTGLENVKKEVFRIECSWSPTTKVNLQSRIESSSYEKGSKKREYGFLLYQDINYKPMSARLSGNLRLAWFKTPSYNSRIYAYEDDVLYGASSALYYGKGIRSFLNFRYRLTRQMDIWGRYAISFFSDQETIGSGLDQIDGNKKSDFKLQFRYQF